MSLLKRGGPVGDQPKGVNSYTICKLALGYPAVFEFLSLEAWEGGEKRTTGTIMILCEDGWFKAWVHDRDGRRAAWMSHESLSDLMAGLDEALQGEGLVWRADKVPGGGGRSKGS